MISCVIYIVEYGEFRRHLSKAGVSLAEFARLLEVQPASVSNHKKNGRVPKHYAVAAVLLGYLGDEHFDFRALLAKHGVLIRAAPPAIGTPAQLKLIASRARL